MEAIKQWCRSSTWDCRPPFVRLVSRVSPLQCVWLSVRRTPAAFACIARRIISCERHLESLCSHPPSLHMIPACHWGRASPAAVTHGAVKIWRGSVTSMVQTSEYIFTDEPPELPCRLLITVHIKKMSRMHWTRGKKMLRVKIRVKIWNVESQSSTVKIERLCAEPSWCTSNSARIDLPLRCWGEPWQ